MTNAQTDQSYDFAKAYRIAMDETVSRPKRKFYLLGLIGRTTDHEPESLHPLGVDALMDILDADGQYLHDVIRAKAEGYDWS